MYVCNGSQLQNALGPRTFKVILLLLKFAQQYIANSERNTRKVNCFLWWYAVAFAGNERQHGPDSSLVSAILRVLFSSACARSLALVP